MTLDRTSDTGRWESRGRVLLVDDEEPLRRAVGRLLQAAGYRVMQAGDGGEAMKAIEAGAFDAIVSDIRMPRMDGVQLLRAVRERDLDVPVILVTAAPEVETAARAVEYGAFAYLLKPVDSAELERTVTRAVGLHGIARAKRQALELLGSQAGLAGDRSGLEAAFDRMLGSLWMAYQPIVSTTDGALYGYEALLRSAEPALPHPGAVLDAAEKLGRMKELGRRVRDAAAAPMAEAPAGARLFVNLHASDLADPHLHAPDAPLSRIASQVVLEITERASLHDSDAARKEVMALRAMGFLVAVDDLGAGYAGLTSFALLDPEVVKLDMSLVRDVDTNPNKRQIVATFARLCRDMGKLVVAEGVETRAERDVLVQLGCQLLQGFLLAKPGKPFPQFAW